MVRDEDDERMPSESDGTTDFASLTVVGNGGGEDEGSVYVAAEDCGVDEGTLRLLVSVDGDDDDDDDEFERFGTIDD